MAEGSDSDPSPNHHPVAGSKPLIDRVKDILMQPQTEWPRIEAESATIGGIYRSYVVILAAIPPIALALGLFLFAFGFRLFNPTGLFVGAVVQYLLGIGSVYVLALIIDALAPSFGSTRNLLSAFKVAAYSMTAAWVAGIFMLIPLLGILTLIGSLYSLYLLYVGLPLLMRTPQDKAIPYVAVTVVAAIVIFAIVSQIASRLMWGFFL